MSIDPQWHKEQVEKYSNDELKSYSIYAETLREILTKASSQHAPLAIVQARPKSVSSFAEKAARKASKYADPVHQITDLCGARVITHTQEQVDQVCEFIKTNFEIDEKNSLDVRTRLGHSEFGYLSVHYIVQITAGEILGIPIPPEIGDRKAEIQVRTVLQHAWADITHDRLYKSGFRVPDRFKRNAAALAATLESSDGQFGRFVNEMDAYVGEYSAYMDREEMDKEIAILEVVLENEPKEANKPAIALRIARIAQSSGDYSTVFEKLEPIAESDSLCTDEILNELGTALVYLAEQERDPEKAAQKAARGQELLRRAGRVDDPLPSQTTGPLEKNECITRASALSTLACSYGKTSGNEYQARDCYRKALTLVPQDPYHLTSLLEYEIFCTRDTDFAAAMRPVLSGAVATCREHIRVGIELPRAYFTIGKLNLLMNQPMEALAAYAKAISFCNSDNACVPDNIYATQEAFLQRINPGRQLPEEHDWIRQLLLLGKACKAGPQILESEKTRSEKGRDPSFPGPVLIIAGGTSEEAEQTIAQYHHHLYYALREFKGTVISGGTESGITGLVGEIAEKLADSNHKNFELQGYLTKNLPNNVRKDARYDDHWTCGKSLGPRAPLQYWINLMAAGVDPRTVKLLGINGGAISAFEYRLALAMGAEVGVIDSSGREADAMQMDSDWNDSRNLLLLPSDIATIISFLYTPESFLDSDKLEDAAKKVHAKFLENNQEEKTKSPLVSWKELSEILRRSNREQVAFAEQTLRAAGYGIRTAPEPITPIEFDEEKVDLMAQMEHGRWNAERLAAGWRFHSDRRNPEQETSPYLVAWSKLPNEVKEKDRIAIRELPKIFAEIGLEIYRDPSLEEYRLNEEIS